MEDTHDSGHQATWTRVLLVEDDESHVLGLTIGLRHEGFVVTAVGDARDVFPAIESVQPEVIILDVMLAGTSGLEVCRELRQRGIDVPIIMVSARGEELDVVVGIEVGADDYVAKPYKIRELVARIRSLLRRRRLAAPKSDYPSSKESDEDIISVGDLVLDPARHEVHCRGEMIYLPLREFQLLCELLENAGRVVTKETLLERVWGFDYDGDPRIVATIIGRLRARIEIDPDNPKQITTIRGVGYRLNDH